ncbi:aminopeptidase N [Puniceicoccaceae bacterium K14]|nr:aminopeptidase N [Puniceicoccaceae bacterium K14]
MMSEVSEVFRKDYKPSDFLISDVYLEFDLEEDVTRVSASLKVEKQASSAADLTLHGENLSLVDVKIDGQVLDAELYSVSEDSLVILNAPDSFELATVVEIKPQENFELSGLYKSTGNYCTQCEAEGFRRITYFLDRPDVMARYRTKIIADKANYPVLLSNGNRVDEGDLEGGRHWALWEDPYRKPSYLFAMVAANLVCKRDEFVTLSGRKVSLEVWVNDFDLNKTDHAMAALKKSMKWDEQRYGLEYDLDIYMIVAVPDFNMGAMENKGLNIFNTKYVLANPETATDDDYEGVDEVIAHEYFHNWTGNRVTCRDWFQLTLKEGLTVFRDQQFTADQTSEAVKRIKDVRGLRAGQFPEDAGPMSHSIRPESYVIMDNFYTATVYRKGAEVIRMYHTLLGEEGFRKGMDLYFERHDGDAVTCDDFRKAMSDANGFDLTQFERWYDQNGTPELFVKEQYDPGSQTLTLELKQASGASSDHNPFHMPIRIALLGPSGVELESKLGNECKAEHLYELKEESVRLVFENLIERPVVSLLRGFSAPVKMRWERSLGDLAFLSKYDKDAFNRWDAGQNFSKEILLADSNRTLDGGDCRINSELLDNVCTILRDDSSDQMFKAFALQLPSLNELIYELPVADPDAVHKVLKQYRKAIAEVYRDELLDTYRSLEKYPAYNYTTSEVNRRAFKNALLSYIVELGDQEAIEIAFAQFANANNMTDQYAALGALCNIECQEREDALAAFYEQWQREALVVDKWFFIQAKDMASDALNRIQRLTKHPDFNIKNPNRVRSLLGVFSRLNLVNFHREDGAGYRLLADFVLQVDGSNGQLAANLVSGFNPWKRFSMVRQNLMKSELERIVAKPGLSGDVNEVVSRALK